MVHEPFVQDRDASFGQCVSVLFLRDFVIVIVIAVTVVVTVVVTAVVGGSMGVY